MFWVEFLVVLFAIFLGSRLGGIGLGAIAGLGLAVLVFVFRIPAGSLPVDVIFIIVAVITAVAALEAAGGLDLLVRLAEKMLRAKPEAITFMAPLVTWLFTFVAGTGHVAYSVLPVIAEVARKAGVRPERPMSIAVIASQQSITAGPISAATAGMIALLAVNDTGLGLKDILLICIPSTLIGVLLGALSMVRYGCKLADDPIFRDRLAKGLVESSDVTLQMPPERIAPAKWSVIIFLIAAVGVVGFGLVDQGRPITGYRATVSVWSLWLGDEDDRPTGWVHDTLSDTVTQRKLSANLDSKAGWATVTGLQPHESIVVLTRGNIDLRDEFRATAPDEMLQKVRDGTFEVAAPSETRVGMAATIQIVMLAAAALIMLLCRASPAAVAGGSVARAGGVAVVAILGLAWLGSTFFEANREVVQDTLSATVQSRPWTFAIALFALSVLLYSQAATVAALMPVGITLGIDPIYLIAMYPAVNGYFFLPTYGTIVAAIQFDQTGTTRIGRFVLNHSFMLPGIVATIGAIGSGFALAALYRSIGLIGGAP
jgi:anaerobic C4-dicarboxylate transporter